ncbi:MAG TPA: universal stress protein [Acidimicrobiales bacterium]|nr:universal stress protein [Acidimicrobiales bacterium]
MADGRIVVGVDGSAPSKAALHWALDEARRRGASVEAVYVWQYPSVALERFGATSVPVMRAEDLEKAAQQVVDEVVSGLSEEDRATGLTTRLERGHPADALLAAAKDAELLVVGSRGLGGFKGMLLGSVSNHVAHHASVPVVVIRGNAG